MLITTRRALRGRNGWLVDRARSAVIAPDPIARDYILLALRLDGQVPGLVDGYFGPAELRAQVDAESPRTPARLREDAADLRARVAGRGW